MQIQLFVSNTAYLDEVKQSKNGPLCKLSICTIIVPWSMSSKPRMWAGASGVLEFQVLKVANERKGR